MRLGPKKVNSLDKLMLTGFFVFNEGANKTEFDLLKSLFNAYEVEFESKIHDTYAGLVNLHFYMCYKTPKHRKTEIYEMMSRFT